MWKVPGACSRATLAACTALTALTVLTGPAAAVTTTAQGVVARGAVAAGAAAGTVRTGDLAVAPSPQAPATPGAGTQSAGTGSAPGPAPAEGEKNTSGENWLTGLLLVAAGVVLGLGTSVVLRRSPTPGSPYPPVLPPVPDHRPDTGGEAADHRLRLLRHLIDLRDLVANPALVQRIDLALEDVGATLLDPRSGTDLDPRVHRVCGTAATDEPTSDRRIAEVVAVGFLDTADLGTSGRQVLRAADVIVYRSTP